MVLNPGGSVCVVAGSTSPPAVLEGEIGRSWVTTGRRERRGKQKVREKEEREQEQNAGLCIPHPMQRCTVLTQQWGQDSAHAVHPKRLQPRVSHDQGLNWEPKDDTTQHPAFARSVSSIGPTEPGTYMQSFSVSLELSVQ